MMYTNNHIAQVVDRSVCKFLHINIYSYIINKYIAKVNKWTLNVC